MVLDPGRMFAEVPAELGQRGRRVHQPAQDGQATWVSEQFDLFKGIKDSTLFIINPIPLRKNLMQPSLA